MNSWYDSYGNVVNMQIPKNKNLGSVQINSTSTTASTFEFLVNASYKRKERIKKLKFILDDK